MHTATGIQLRETTLVRLLRTHTSNNIITIPLGAPNNQYFRVVRQQALGPS